MAINKKLVVEAKKVIFRKDQTGYELTGFKSAKKSRLPKKYLTSDNHAFVLSHLGGSKSLVVSSKGENGSEKRVYRLGSVLSKEEWDTLSKNLKSAGNNLTSIKKNLEREKKIKKWKGASTFKI